VPVNFAMQRDAYTVDGSIKADRQSAQDRFAGRDRSKVNVFATENPAALKVSKLLTLVTSLMLLELPEASVLLRGFRGEPLLPAEWFLLTDFRGELVLPEE
jgi:hypothetical protein